MRISDWSSDVCSSDLAGLEDLQRGEVRIGGRTVAGARVNIPTERRHVGMVFQDHALFPHLSVAANIAFGLSHLPAAGQRDRAAFRSEEHTSELQSLMRTSYAGFCLKKKKKKTTTTMII